MADIRGGREGGRGRCLLNICIPRCRWKNIQVPRRLSIRGGFIYIMHCPSSVSVCYFIDRACDISSLFFFSLFLRFSPIFIQNSFSVLLFSSLSLSSSIRSRRACTYLARNNDSVIGSANGVNTENLFLEFPPINTCCG